MPVVSPRRVHHDDGSRSPKAPCGRWFSFQGVTVAVSKDALQVTCRTCFKPILPVEVTEALLRPAEPEPEKAEE